VVVPDPRDPRDERDDRDQTADELAWQAIVDNFGERVEIDEPAAEEPPAPEQPPATPFGGRFADASGFATWTTSGELDSEDPHEPAEEGYVPPPPPPLPRLAPDRALAWAGVFGSPVVLLFALLLSVSIPSWLGYLMIAGFVGGFGYLVVKMPREPRDPWDDGAQV
jgi:hypothetical protein